jgi:hypothetical protein
MAGRPSRYIGSLYWMDSDLSHLIAKFPCRDGPDRRLVGVRDKRRRHDCLIDSIQQLARALGGRSGGGVSLMDGSN